MKPDFLGTYPCVSCGKKVRVYGWLPEAVLCAKCKREVADEEAATEEKP